MSKSSRINKQTYELYDGARVIYIPKYIKNSADLYNELKTNVHWEKFKYTVYDKEVESPRLMSIIDLDKKLKKLPIFDAVKNLIEKKTKLKFTYAVLNYYRDGSDYISYHADREMKAGSSVVSISLGAKRKFVLKHKYRPGVKHEFWLGNGDILMMNEAALKLKYKHSVPKMANVGPRISITLRE
jgi:alkylated DNA repair dioxygenase AlkB